MKQIMIFILGLLVIGASAMDQPEFAKKDEEYVEIGLDCLEEGQREKQTVLGKVIEGLGLSADKKPKLVIHDESPRRLRVMAKNMMGHIHKSWPSWKGKCALTLTAALATSLGLYLIRYYRMKKVAEENDALPLTPDQVHKQVIELLKEHQLNKKPIN